jgi:hypothetical protein
MRKWNFARVEDVYSAWLFIWSVAAVWGGVLWVFIMAIVD